MTPSAIRGAHLAPHVRFEGATGEHPAGTAHRRPEAGGGHVADQRPSGRGSGRIISMSRVYRPPYREDVRLCGAEDSAGHRRSQPARCRIPCAAGTPRRAISADIVASTCPTTPTAVEKFARPSQRSGPYRGSITKVSSDGSTNAIERSSGPGVAQGAQGHPARAARGGHDRCR